MRLLIVEDEPKVARFVERGLREEHFAVDVAVDGESGLDLALVHDYDLVVLDVMLPKKDGFEVLEALRAARRPCKVLMLTARDSVKDAELLARVRALLRRAGGTEVTTLSFADLVLDVKARKVTRAGQPVALSAREFAVLEHLLRHQGEVISRTRLSEQVWDQHFDSMTNVIDVTLYHLREKVDRGFPAPLIHTVRGVGYVLKNPAA
jgi:DNA-binding response OmpR family regulator